MNQFLVDLADQLGLDSDQFSADIENQAVIDKVHLDMQDAANLMLPGTPALIVDGFIVSGDNLPRDFAIWEAYVEEAKLVAEIPQYEKPEMMIDTDAVYQATVTMADGGQFVMDLYPQSAPETVNSFVFLANQGWFDGVTFHRVLAGFVAQTGDPSGSGRGGPGYTIPNEIDPELTHAEIGMVAMANSGPNTNGSQWYITLGDASFLDGDYTIFGRVVEGMDDVVMNITPRDPATATGPGDVIESIVVEIKPE